jgi:hypothetical protein
MRNSAYAMTGMFQSGEWHPVDAECGVVVHHDSRCVELFECVHAGVDVF